MLLDNPELADVTLNKTKLKEFVLLISKTQNAPSQIDFLSVMFKKNNSELKKTIINNVFSNLSIEEFAHLCGISLSTFKDSLKKYIVKKRLELASLKPLGYKLIGGAVEFTDFKKMKEL